MADGQVFFVQKTFEIFFAVAPALAQQARQFEAAWQIKLGTQVGLKQGDVGGAAAIALALHQLIGPKALLVFIALQLAIRAVVTDAGDLGLGKAGQAEGAKFNRLAAATGCQCGCSNQPAGGGFDGHGLARSGS